MPKYAEIISLNANFSCYLFTFKQASISSMFYRSFKFSVDDNIPSIIAFITSNSIFYISPYLMNACACLCVRIEED
ncbi:hypothetical protein T10_1912 [Trichinella papuae]|uniref:Uncharacterized protein n=1 Tax=Trichinella papuae TaxID=268474 RepID=A0A0V1MW16_9BILA|nr:hypothetical protein T10_1912 [Trichinella papuae]